MSEVNPRTEKTYSVIRLSRFLVVTILMFLFLNSYLFAASPDEEREKALLETHISGLKRIIIKDADVKVQIARNLMLVRSGLMSAKMFYKSMAHLEMPQGKETRHMLNEVKKDIANYMAAGGKAFFFGAELSGGGTEVEMKLLTWRRDVTVKAMNEVLAEFRGKNVINDQKIRVFRADIGSWASESPQEMKFAGDIDFSFLAGDLELAKAMKQAFDRIIFDIVGLTAEQFDTVCTAHGMATDEVYLGKHGQSFAEDSIKKGEVIEILMDEGKFGGKVNGQEALQHLALDRKYARLPITDIQTVKWPTEPGISLEMIRHFEHDIVKQNVYTDMDSFMKAVKYLERSIDALKKNFGVDPNPAFSKLSEFAAALMKKKKGKAGEQVELIREYFKSINQPFPYEIRLGPENEKGQSRVEVEAKEKIIKDFWEDCSRAMWSNVTKGIDLKMKDLSARMAGVQNEAQARELHAELEKIREMMEIEYHVLQDPEVGLKKLPEMFHNQMKEFRSVYKAFMKKWGIKIADLKSQQTFKFVDEMLKAKQQSNIYLAMAALTNATHFVNNHLDSIDDMLLGELRGEKGPDWQTYLKESREAYWAGKAEKHLGRSFAESKVKAHLVKTEQIMRGIDDHLNRLLHDNFAARKVKGINRAFGEAIQSSRVAQAGMTTLVAINLAQEIPAYIDQFSKGVYEGDWSGLATEFFRRRIPFGSAVENYYMDRYTLATWDTIVTFVPPVALLQVAVDVSKAAAEYSWHLWWSTELDLFIDTLYKDATFKLDGIERYNEKFVLSRWRLAKVTYKGKEEDLEEFTRMKREQIEEMQRSLKEPLSRRVFPISLKYEGITGWMEVDDLLRRNLADTDSWLSMIEEMIKHPSVGPKLKDHYKDIWYTRWETVKLNFIIQMIKLLEDRRTAEQAVVSGQLPEMSLELTKIAEQLKIKNELDKSLKEEVGGIFWEYYTWLRDWLVGQKRAFYSQAEVWKETEKGAAVVQNYLRVYKTTLDARTAAEEMFVIGPAEDYGLRILTGPYFLAGKAGNDESSFSQWLKVSEQTSRDARGELQGIKRKYVPADLDIEFDKPRPQRKSSFDKEIFEKIVYHDVWRELWKHVNSQGISKAPSFWNDIRVLMSGSGGGAGVSDQDFAVSRHRYHKEQRDRLVKQFEEYYRWKQEEAAGKTKTEGVAQESDELRKKGEALSGRAKVTAGEVEALCKTAREKAEKAKAELENLKKETDRIKNKIKAVKEKLAKLSEKVQKANTHKDEAYRAGEKVVEAKQKIETLLSQLCKNADAVKNADSGNVPRLLSEIEKANEAIGKLRQEAEREARRSKDEARKAEDLYNETKEIPLEIEDLKVTISGLQSRLESVQKATREAREAAGKAKEKVSELESMKGEAAALLKDAKNKLEPIKETDKAKEITKGMEGTVGVIATTIERAKKCPEEFKATFEPIEKSLSSVENDIKTARSDIESVTLSGSVQDSIAKIQDSANKAKGSADAAEVYLTWVEKYAIDASQCVRSAKENAAQASDKSISHAKAALNACNFEEARRLINLVAAGPNRTQLEQEYTRSNSHEEKTQALFQEANNQYMGCNFDGALARLNEALNHTRCEKYRTSLRDKIITAKQAKGHEDRTNSLFQEAKTSYKGCNFEDAEAKLNEALRHTKCDKNRDSLREKVVTVKKAKEHEERTQALFEEAKRLYSACSYDEALAKLNEALSHTRCDRYKASLNEKTAKVQQAKAHEDTTNALFQQANTAYKQGNLNESLALLLKALDHTKCDKFRNSLSQKIAQVQAEIEKEKRPLPAAPSPPPPIAPSPQRDTKHFYVVFQLHLPMPKQMPEWTKQKPPTNADEATKKRFSEEKKRRLEAFANSLTLGSTVIQPVELQKWALGIHIAGSALSAYPQGIFQRGEKFSLPYKGSGQDLEGKLLNIDAAFLLTVAETFDSIESARAVYPSFSKKDSALLELNNSGGTMDYQDSKGSARLGPLTKGWANENMQKSLVMTRILLTMLGGECFIATAVYGDRFAPALNILRKFRDTVLLSTEEGTRLVNAYYKYGPILAEKVRQHPFVIPVLRTMLDMFVGWLRYADLDDPDTRIALNGAVVAVEKGVSVFIKTKTDTIPERNPGQLNLLFNAYVLRRAIAE